MEKITQYLIQSTVHTSEVRAWEEDILLPTYEIGKEEKNPIFLEKRVYQGSCGSVYPYPVVEKISDKKVDKQYHALFIENEYIKVMILPELGGRVHMAYDKVKKRHFVYYNQVVKPALVGLTGPWISGGIEFNWPQHHRPSTYLPTDFSIEENPDGSKTIWCNEVERMFRTKGMQGFTLYPGKAYIEIKVKIYNRTSFPQTFLWWANPAVVVNDHYHSVFPPDVNAVFDHGKRDVSSFPIATGTYYKQDYSAGVDISKYKNIPVPTSYMAIKSKFDFVGGYEADVQGGLLHVADHHVSPGKKQWTWGNGNFGRAWDRNLTDEDGPYIELMTGMYTDNQPDFSWLQPYEEKSWVQYFMPYSEVGYVKNATKDALLNLELKDGESRIVLYTTGVNKDLNILVKDNRGNMLFDKTLRISPAEPFAGTFPTGDLKEEEIRVEVRNREGKVILSYQADKPEIKPVPDPAKAAKDPKDIASIEQLFLTGLHLEQYRHATYNPMDYYMEALHREPGDVRCNNAVGLLLMRKGQFAQAEAYFRKAVETLTERNPNPYDGEPYYNLGWSCKMQGKPDEAYDAFFKSAWNAAWQDAAYFALAQIETQKGNYESALDKADRSLIRNWHNHKARQLKASILRKLNRKEEALALIEESLKIDRFNMGCRFELYLLTQDEKVLADMKTMMRNWSHGFLEYALDFAAAGLYDEAIALLQSHASGAGNVYPMVYYALGYFHACMGENEKALEYYQKAEKENHAYCFPNRIEEVLILQSAVAMNKQGAKAAYSLGNFWYSARQYDSAVACWETSASVDPSFPTVWRNLSLAYYNKQNEKQKALEALERAYRLDEHDSRILMELDQLYKRLGRPHAERLAFLEAHLAVMIWLSSVLRFIINWVVMPKPKI
jgi:tetratricopeptide (TPR) repeat protein